MSNPDITEFLTAPEGEFSLPIVLVMYGRPADHLHGEHFVTPILHSRLARMADDGVIHEEWNYAYDLPGDETEAEAPNLWEHADLHEWQSEVSAGDTLRSFAEWIAHKAELAADEAKVKTTYACPACGSSDNLLTIEQVEAYAILLPDGEFEGTTEYEGEHVTVGIGCGNCPWQVKRNGDKDALLNLYAKRVDTPVQA